MAGKAENDEDCVEGKQRGGRLQIAVEMRDWVSQQMVTQRTKAGVWLDESGDRAGRRDRGGSVFKVCTEYFHNTAR
ncbi:uncharacterized protein SPSK_05727 [Sporothrix schenckii 1099-18]|uniref:Uncharacterized protein n=1 Tax=Sporothrix schenckii 1099-18 TaxID=1397361 RepID=A0A0F2LWU1_SPOSC|nr:uncharacterized protein SPSK_05727 [Sporothrix schenckii 1099-18]KJR80376.1 hypothetical protein SPSK_05727 [Sporothrix schenckii 1099-18]